LGLGKGLSVLELIKLFENTTGTHIPIVWGKRRVGDVDTLVCDAKVAIKELQWVPKYDAVRMCKLTELISAKLASKTNGSVCDSRVFPSKFKIDYKSAYTNDLFNNV